jgi:hypothetical protein
MSKSFPLMATTITTILFCRPARAALRTGVRHHLCTPSNGYSDCLLNGYPDRPRRLIELHNSLIFISINAWAHFDQSWDGALMAASISVYDKLSTHLSTDFVHN